MAKTTIPIELSSTPSIVDGGNATAITIDSSEDVTLAGELKFADSKKAIFGAGEDATIFSDGTSGYIRGFTLQNKAGDKDVLTFADGGATSLFHNNSAKLATTSTGIDVTGTAVTDGLTSSGHVNISSGLSYQWGDSHERIEQSDGKIEFFTNNGEAMTLSSGNLGVGTTSPQETLHLFNSAQSWNQYANIRMSTESDSYAAEIGFHRGTSDDSDRGLFLSGDGTNKHVRILHGGNVGIGRTDPTQLLEVHKSTGGDQTVAKFSAHNYGDTGKTFIEIGTENGDGSSRIGSFNDTGNKSVLIFETHSATSGQFTEHMRIKSDGQITTQGDILPGADVIMANGRGISFAATANSSGSMSSELLDDYEEGTWTPSVTGMSIQTQTGNYTKIGDLVFIKLRLSWNSYNNSAGGVLTGLPFAADTSNESMAFSVYVNSGFGSIPSGKGYLNAYIASNNTTLNFTWQPNTAVAEFASSGNIYVAGTYLT